MVLRYSFFFSCFFLSLVVVDSVLMLRFISHSFPRVYFFVYFAGVPRNGSTVDCFALVRRENFVVLV